MKNAKILKRLCIGAVDILLCVALSGCTTATYIHSDGASTTEVRKTLPFFRGEAQLGSVEIRPDGTIAVTNYSQKNQEQLDSTINASAAAIGVAIANAMRAYSGNLR